MARGLSPGIDEHGAAGYAGEAKTDGDAKYIGVLPVKEMAIVFYEKCLCLAK